MTTTEKTIAITRNERKFITCYDCKAKSTFDFTVELWEPCNYAPYGMDVCFNGEIVKNTYVKACPHCGSSNIARKELKKAKYSAKHVCDDRCQTATAETCTCSCEGKNHGIKNKVVGSLFF